MGETSTFVRPLLALLWALSLVGGVSRGSAEQGGRLILPAGGQILELVRIPAGQAVLGRREPGSGSAPGEVQVGTLWIGTHEVSVSEYVEFLNERPPGEEWTSPQIVLRRGSYRPAQRCGNRPVAYVSRADAGAFCQWLSETLGRSARLPTEIEWEYAARGGIRRARYPWGWGHPGGRACFDAGAPRRVGSYDPNPFGLYDMAGNVFEWCVPDPPPADPDRSVARGGSWAERDPDMLRVDRRTWFPRDYRDADVGFRVVVEMGD